MTRSLKMRTLRLRRTDVLPPLYKRYRFIALATYGLVLLAGLVDVLTGGIGPNSLVSAPQGVRFVIFLAAILGLIGLESAALGSASFRASERVGLPQLAFRLLLFAAILAFGDPLYSQVVFLVLILYLYLAVSKWVSYAVAAASLLLLLSQGVGINPTLPTLQPPPAAGRPLPGQPPSTSLPLGQLVDRGFGVLVILFFTFLLARAVARAAADQAELETLHTSLEASHHDLRASTDQIAELAATEERNRVARDVHDSLGHHLAAINIQLEKANAYKERDPKRTQDAVKQAQRTVQDALKDVRESVGSLRKSTPFSFDDALESLLARMRHGDLELKLQRMGDSRGYSDLVLMTLYRVIQEGLTNIHKHAGASQVTLSLDFGDERLTLNLCDDGSGFDASGWQERRSGFGLVGLQERLGLVGGKLTLQSQPHGTRLTATIPKTRPGRGQER